MKENVIETPLIGSGSAEEAERRVQVLLEMMGTTVPVTIHRSALSPAV